MSETNQTVSLDYTATLDDQVSAGAQAAADALGALADSASQVDDVVSKAGPSFSTLSKRLDENAQYAAAADAAQRRLTQSLATIQSAVESGATTQAAATELAARAQTDYALALDKATASAAKTAARYGDVTDASAEMAGASGQVAATVRGAGAAADEAGAAHQRLGFFTAGATREFIVMGSEITRGNYSRIPGSLMVLGERVNDLEGKLASLGGFFTSMGGIAAVGAAVAVGALAYMAVEAENASLAVEKLQAKLALTNVDYVSMSQSVMAAARGATSTPGFNGSGADAKAAATSFAPLISDTTVAGSEADLKNLTVLAGQLAYSMGETVPNAAKILAEGLKDPTAEAKKLADDGFTYLDAATVRTIQRMQDSGDTAGAQALLMQRLQETVSTTADSLTPFQVALRGLSAAFDDSGSHGTSFGKSIGQDVMAGVTGAVNALAWLVTKLQEAHDATGKLLPWASGYQNPTPQGGTPIQPFVAAPHQAPPLPDGSLNGGAFGSDTADMIYAQANKFGVSQSMATFAANIARVESGGRQFDKSGNLLTSSANAQGIMQVQPGTRDQYAPGLDLANPVENIDAGLFTMQGLSADPAVGNDQAKIAAAYNMGLQGFKDATKNGGQIPPGVQDYVRNVLQLPAGAPLPNMATPAEQYGPNPSPDDIRAGQVASQGISAGMKAAASGTDDYSKQAQDLQDAITKFTALRAQVAPGTDEWNAFNAQIEAATGKLNNLKDPIQKAIDNVTKQADVSNTAAGATRTYAQAMQSFQQTQETAGRDATVAEKMQFETETLQKLSSAYNDQMAVITQDTDNEVALGDAHEKGTAAVVDLTNSQKAMADVRKSFLEGSDAYNSAVATETDALNAQSAATVDATTKALLFDQAQQLDTLKQEAGFINETADARARDTAILTERNALVKQGADLESDASQQAMANAGSIADATSAMQKQQAAMTELQNFGQQAFTKIGDFISQAFVSGQGAAVSFQNVVSSVMSEIVTEVLKLGVLNPILNSLFGGNATTLSGVLGAGAVGAAASGSTGSGASADTSSTGLLSNLTGLSKLFSAGSGSLSPSLDAWSQATLGFGQVATTSNTAASALYGGAAGGAQSVASAGGLLNGGDPLAGFGSASNILGIGGAVLPGLISGNYGQAAAGGIGAAIGTAVLPGIGTVLGGLAGNLLGGLFGGGKVQHHGWDIDVGGLANGQLGITANGADKFDNSDTVIATQNDIAAMNTILSQNGIRATPQQTQLGGSNGVNQPTDLSDAFNRLRFSSSDAHMNDAIGNGQSFASSSAFTTAISAFDQFSEQLPALLNPVEGATTSIGSLQTAFDTINTTYASAITSAQKYGYSVTDLTNAQAQATAIVQQQADQATAATMTDLQQREAVANDNSPGAAQAQKLASFDSSGVSQTAALTKQLTDLYGDAFTATQSYTDDMNQLADTLAAERNVLVTAYQKQQDQATESAYVSQVGTIAAGWTAEASTTSGGNWQETLDATMANFDASAGQQVQALASQLTTTFGDSYAQSAAYSQRIVELETSLGQQRLAVIQQFYDQGRQQVTGVLSSLSSYASGLATSNASPLSAQGQYSLAQSQYNAVQGSAAAGNFQSMQELQQYASAYLTASKNLYGSGTQYASDFSSVVDVLSKIAATPPDTLTTSALQSISQTQTDQLVTALASLQNEVVLLRAEVAQNTATPLRVVA